MSAEEYLSGSRLYRCLKSGPHGQLVELYAARLVKDGLDAARLVKDGLGRQGTWRSLNLFADLMGRLASSGLQLADFNECVVEQYLRHRAKRRSIQAGDRAAFKRLLAALREAGTIAPAALPPLTPHEQVFEAFSRHLRDERGLAPKSIVRHLPIVRLFLREVCPGGAGDLGRIGQESVTRYIKRHAGDWSAGTGKAMCWALRAFLRYFHCKGLNQPALAGCVPSIRSWKLAGLPTYLAAVQVQKVLGGCDRATALGRRDYAILMMLAKLGMWAPASAAGSASKPAHASRSQPITCCELSCHRRATADTIAPGSSASATIRALSSTDQRRRRPGPVSTSTRRYSAFASSLLSNIMSARSSPPQATQPQSTLNQEQWPQSNAYDALHKALRPALDAITANDAQGYFRNSGYSVARPTRKTL